MVTKVEVNGYEIVIEEKEGVISVSALKDDEVVEEFELETEEGQGFDDEDLDSEEGDEVQDFDSFGQDEEEDFDSEEDEDFGQDEDEDEDFGQDDEEDEDEDEKGESQLESFQSFINKRK